MKKFIIILDGPMGSGKSTIGAMLKEKLKRTAVINEDMIKWFISDFRRSKRDNAIARAVLIEMSKEYPKHGISLIIAQGFVNDYRPLAPYKKIAKKNNFRFLVYHLDAPKNILLERVKSRKKTREAAWAPIAESRVHRNIRYWKNNRFTVGTEFRTDQVSAEQIVNEILKDLKRNGR